MMCRRFLLSVFTGFSFLAVYAAAASSSPVHWTVEDLPSKPVGQGEVFTVTLVAQIQPGWHIYAMDEPEGGPIPTQIGLAEGDPLDLLAVNEPKPRMSLDPVLRQLTGMFENRVAFTIRLRSPRLAVPTSAISRILARYQSCNDEICLPPHTETVTLPLNEVLHCRSHAKIGDETGNCAQTGLGTIDHTLVSLEAMRQCRFLSLASRS